MEQVRLPNTNLDIFPICLGTMLFGSAISQEEAFAILDTYVEQGGNVLDTAHIYAAWLPNAGGVSERTVGIWLRKHRMRKAMVVGTKGGHPHLDSMHIGRLSPEDIRQDLCQSLERLQTDHVDLYWLHRDDPKVPIDEVLCALNEHITLGLVRYIGASNWSVDRLREAERYAQKNHLKGFCASQIGWSLAQQRGAKAYGALYMDDATRQFHDQSGMPVFAYSPQALGFFSGKYNRTDTRPTPKVGKVLDMYGTDKNFDRLDRAELLAQRHGRSANEIALAYLLNQPFCTIPVVGPRTKEQIAGSCAAVGLTLTSKEIDLLEGQ